MKYKTKTVSLDKLIIDHQGLVMPLCNTCQNNDCTNPIETVDVSFIGIVKPCKIINEYSARAVVQCEGYISESKNKNDNT